MSARRGANRRALTVACLLLLSACDGYPRDMSGTLERVEKSHVIKLGTVDVRDDADKQRLATYVAALGTIFKARVEPTELPADRAFALLDNGKLDLVAGEFDKATPWVDDVTMIEPLAERTVDGRKFMLAAVVRNGENAWLNRLERMQRDIGQQQ